MHRLVPGLVRLALARIAAALLLTGTLAATEPAPNFAHWEQEISAFEASDRTNPPPRGAIVFTGSSTVRMWRTLATDFPEHRVINRGFGGCRTEDCTHFADRMIIPYAPRLIVLRSGGNDIHDGKSPAQVAADFQAFAEKIHSELPDTKIAFISMNPSVNRWEQAPRERDANQLIQVYMKGKSHLMFIDVNDLSLGPDGRPDPERFLADGLHFNATGYRLLAERVRPYLAAKAAP